MKVLALLLLLSPMTAHAGRAVMEQLAASNNAIFIDTTNARVGFSTVTAATTLDVAGNAQFGRGASKSTFTATGDLVMGSNAVSASAATFSSVTINQSGSIGLDVQGTTPKVNIGNGVNTGVVYAQLVNAGNGMYIGSEGTTPGFFPGGVSYQKFLGTNGAYPLGLYTNNFPRLVIDSSGNVGISTNSPASRLHVVGSAGLALIAERATSGVYVASFTAGGYDVSIFGGSFGGTTGALIGTTGNTRLAFMTKATTAMTIDPSQNIGVGTVSPCSSCTLHVAGNINATGTVTQTVKSCTGGLQTNANGDINGCNSGGGTGDVITTSSQTLSGVNTFTSTVVFSGSFSGDINVASETVIPQSTPATMTTYSSCLAGSTITLNMPFAAYVQIQGVIATIDGGAGDYEGVGFLMDGAYGATGANGIAFESTSAGGGNSHALYPNFITPTKIAGGQHTFCLTQVNNDGGTTRFGDTGTTGHVYSWYRVSTRY